MRCRWRRVNLQSVCARSFPPEEADVAKSGLLGFGDFLAVTCSEMKLLGVSQGLRDSQGNRRRTWKPRDAFCWLCAISGLSECCSQYFPGSPWPCLLDCPSCPLCMCILVVYNPSDHLQMAFAGLCCVSLDMLVSGQSEIGPGCCWACSGLPEAQVVGEGGG